MPSDFKFEYYKSRTRGSRAEVWLTAGRINIGVPVYEGMGSPPRIRFSYDARNKAIQLEPAQEDGIKVAKEHSRRSVSLGVAPGTLDRLPKGSYTPIGGGIFIHESLQR